MTENRRYVVDNDVVLLGVCRYREENALGNLCIFIVFSSLTELCLPTFCNKPPFDCLKEALMCVT